MAFFKILRGNRDSLDSTPKNDGYAYFCIDDGTFHIDYVDKDSVLQRKQINANEAEKLIGYNVSTVLNSDDTEIPTSNSVIEYVIDSSDSVLTASKAYTDEEIAKVGGVDGKSAYEIWLEQGNTGTEEDFLESLKGKDGTSGVYVGSGDMPEGYNVQIDPDGDTVDLLEKIDEVLAEAKTYTNALADGAVATNTEDITDVRYEINEACKSSFISDCVVRLDGVKPCSNIELTWESDYQTLDFVVRGKNLLTTKYNSKDSGSFENSPGSWEIQEDGGIRLFGEIGNGEILNLGDFRLPPDTYTLSGLPDNCPADTSFTLWVGGSSLASINASDEESRIVTFTEEFGGGGFNCQLEFSKTTTYDYTGVVIYPQIELGETASSYENWQLEESFPGTTKGSSIPAFSPTTTIYEYNDIYFSVGSKIDLKPSITQYIQESADSVLAEAKTYTDEEIAKLQVDLTNYTTIDNVEEMILERSKKEHPVGSLYLSMIEANPADILGFGTWQLVGANRMIMGATNSSQAGDLGGYESHTHETAFRFASWYNEVVLENHEETGIMAYEPNGSKTATGNTRVAYTSVDSENNYYNASTETSRTASGQMGVYESVGNTSYEPNTPPYIKINIWQRTA